MDVRPVNSLEIDNFRKLKTKLAGFMNVQDHEYLKMVQEQWESFLQKIYNSLEPWDNNAILFHRDQARVFLLEQRRFMADQIRVRISERTTLQEYYREIAQQNRPIMK